MKAVIHYHPDATHQRVHAEAMRSGLAKHGVEVSYGGYNAPSVRSPDFAVIWGAPSKQPAVAASVPHVLVMERGHVGDRMQLASVGWDGLARRGRYPVATDGGARWGVLFGDLMEPWTKRLGYALIIGQVHGDAALAGLDAVQWARDTDAMLRSMGWETRFRPHPFTAPSRRSLAQDLAEAGLCVTYNSTAGVEAVLAGVPTTTVDEGAMAWPVTGHMFQEIVRPEREAWAHDLAFTSWSLEEIAAGMPWEHLAPLLEEAACPSA